MSRVLYFDCFSGISGDMALGALLDAGLPLDGLKRALGSLALADCQVSATKVLRAGISATKFDVHEAPLASGEPGPSSHEHPAEPHVHESGPADHAHEHGPDHHDHARDGQHDHDGPHGHASDVPRESSSHVHASDVPRKSPSHVHQAHRTLPEIFALIDRSGLSAGGRARARSMFGRLAEAEAAVHQMPVERVHLHEVGALDSIVDIVGVVHALEWANADRIVCSPLNVGGGMVQSAHGIFPVPAPATVRLLGAAPVYSGAIQKELVTPTGALIVASYADAFGTMPAMSVEQVGYGAGERDHPSTPNVLRVFIGRAAEETRTERVVVVECEIDDMNPQIFGVVMDQLYAAGALDVFYVPVQMKKNRPGTLLTVIVSPERRAEMATVIFRETTTIGLRYSEVERECLDREIVSVATPIGAVRFKVARREGRVLNAVPEFEDCAKLAAVEHLSVKEVQAMAVSAYRDGHYAGPAWGVKS
jgi:hypothetical protein